MPRRRTSLFSSPRRRSRGVSSHSRSGVSHSQSNPSHSSSPSHARDKSSSPPRSTRSAHVSSSPPSPTPSASTSAVLSDDEDLVCCVCLNGDVEAENEILICEGTTCGTCAVHQACYGVRQVPEDAFLCRPCTLAAESSNSKLEFQCTLCPVKGGALARSLNGLDWIHVQCALFCPEAFIRDTENMDCIDLSQVDPLRWRMTCSICNSRQGAAVQCWASGCKTAFHVGCAAKKDFLLSIFDSGLDDQPSICAIFCPKHSSAEQVEKSKVRIIKEAQEKQAQLAAAQSQAAIQKARAKPKIKQEAQSKRDGDSQSDSNWSDSEDDSSSALPLPAPEPMSIGVFPSRDESEEDATVRSAFMRFIESYFPALRLEDLLRLGVNANRTEFERLMGVDDAAAQSSKRLALALMDSVQERAARSRSASSRSSQFSCVRTFQPLSSSSECLPRAEFQQSAEQHVDPCGLVQPSAVAARSLSLSSVPSAPPSLVTSLFPGFDPSLQVAPLARPASSDPLNISFDIPQFTDNPALLYELGLPSNPANLKRTQQSKPTEEAAKGRRKPILVQALMQRETQSQEFDEPKAALASFLLSPPSARDSDDSAYVVQLTQFTPACTLPPAGSAAHVQIVSEQSENLPLLAPSCDPYGDELDLPPLVDESGKRTSAFNHVVASLSAAAAGQGETLEDHEDSPKAQNEETLSELIQLQLQLVQQIDANEQRRFELRQRIPASTLNVFSQQYSRWSASIEGIYLQTRIWETLRHSIKRGMRDCALPPALLAYHQRKFHYNLTPALTNLSQAEIESNLEVEMEQRDNYSVCCVCMDAESDELINPIVYCDSCNLAVHKACYGIRIIPEEEWFCDYCAATNPSAASAAAANAATTANQSKNKRKSRPAGSPLPPPVCLLCPLTGGALKQVAFDGDSSGANSPPAFVHVSCALWTPFVRFSNLVDMKPILDPRALECDECAICKTQHGATVRCSTPGCTTAFHVMCAWYFGLFFEVQTNDLDCSLSLFCFHHTPNDQKQSDHSVSASLASCIRLSQQRELRNRGRQEHSKNKRRRRNALQKQRMQREDQYEFGRCCVCFQTDEEIRAYQAVKPEIRERITHERAEMARRDPEAEVQHRVQEVREGIQTLELFYQQQDSGIDTKENDSKSSNAITEAVNAGGSSMTDDSASVSAPEPPEESEPDNHLLRCDECGIQVHSRCYGVPPSEIARVMGQKAKPKRNSDSIGSDLTEAALMNFSIERDDADEVDDCSSWLCKRCVGGPREVSCVLCPRKGGAFVRTADKQWVHVVCSRWYPEIQWTDGKTLDRPFGHDDIPQSIRRLRCYLCSRPGPCVDCSESCSLAFHPLCGYFAGQHMAVLVDSRDPDSVTSIGHCLRHSSLFLIPSANIPSEYCKLWAVRRAIEPLQAALEKIRRREILQFLHLEHRVNEWRLKIGDEKKSARPSTFKEVDKAEMEFIRMEEPERRIIADKKNLEELERLALRRSAAVSDAPVQSVPLVRKSHRASSDFVALSRPRTLDQPQHFVFENIPLIPTPVSSDGFAFFDTLRCLVHLVIERDSSLTIGYADLDAAVAGRVPGWERKSDLESYFHRDYSDYLLQAAGIKVEKQLKMMELNGNFRKRRFFQLTIDNHMQADVYKRFMASEEFRNQESGLGPVEDGIRQQITPLIVQLRTSGLESITCSELQQRFPQYHWPALVTRKDIEPLFKGAGITLDNQATPADLFTPIRQVGRLFPHHSLSLAADAHLQLSAGASGDLSGSGDVNSDLSLLTFPSVSARSRDQQPRTEEGKVFHFLIEHLLLATVPELLPFTFGYYQIERAIKRRVSQTVKLVKDLAGVYMQRSYYLSLLDSAGVAQRVSKEMTSVDGKRRWRRFFTWRIKDLDAAKALKAGATKQQLSEAKLILYEIRNQKPEQGEEQEEQADQDEDGDGEQETENEPEQINERKEKEIPQTPANEAGRSTRSKAFESPAPRHNAAAATPAANPAPTPSAPASAVSQRKRRRPELESLAPESALPNGIGNTPNTRKRRTRVDDESE